MPEPTAVLTPQPGAGSGVETPPQATEPSTTPTGVAVEPQQPGAGKVEPVNQTPTTPTPTRQKVSEFYQQRDKQRRLEAEVKILKDALTKLSEQPKPTVEAKPEKTREEILNDFYKDPLGYHEKAVSELKKEIAQLKQDILDKELPAFMDKRKSADESKQKEEAALEILFPKGNSNLGIDERIEANQERAKGIMEIFKRFGLNAASSENPIAVAEAVLKLYDIENKSATPNNPNVPRKAQMASTAAGVPGGGQGGAKVENIPELRAESEKLKLQIGANPELRLDEKFMERYHYINTAMGRAVKGE